jgi:hypothetical protein
MNERDGRRWTLAGYRLSQFGTQIQASGPAVLGGERIGVMPVSEHEATMAEALGDDPTKWRFETLLAVGDALLAKVYPADVFTGESGNPGARLVAALRDCRAAARTDHGGARMNIEPTDKVMPPCGQGIPRVAGNCDGCDTPLWSDRSVDVESGLCASCRDGGRLADALLEAKMLRQALARIRDLAAPIAANDEPVPARVEITDEMVERAAEVLLSLWQDDGEYVDPWPGVREEFRAAARKRAREVLDAALNGEKP